MRGSPRVAPSLMRVLPLHTGEVGDTAEFLGGTAGGVGDGVDRELRTVEISSAPVVGNRESRWLGISVHPGSASEVRVIVSVGNSKCVTSRTNGTGAGCEGTGAGRKGS